MTGVMTEVRDRQSARPTFVRFISRFRTRTLTDLRRRIKATKWPERETVNG